MVLSLFPLVAYLASAAYLVSWLLRLSRALFLKGRAGWLRRKMAGKVISLKMWGRADDGSSTWISLAGAVCGGVVTFWLSQVLIKEWLLVVFVVLVVASEELRGSSKETKLLEVLIFFERFPAHISQDLFETLTGVIRELPAGDLQNGVREAVLRRRSGAETEKSLEAMCGIDLLLDEFILTLRLAAWQNGPALNLILNRLLARAGRRWDRASRILWINDRVRPYVFFGRGAVIAGLWVIMISSSATLANVMPGRTVIIWAALMLLGLGLLFYLFLKSHLLRRSLAISIFIIALVSYANSLVIPIPSWIQVETISHLSASGTDHEAVPTQVLEAPLEQAASFQLPDAFNYPPTAESADPTSTSTSTPADLPTLTNTPSVLLSTPFSPKVAEPCCSHSRQPR